MMGKNHDFDQDRIMGMDGVAALQEMAVDFFGDILDEARSVAARYGFQAAGPSHLLQALMMRPEALRVIAEAGAEPVAIQEALRQGLNAHIGKPLEEKPPFDEPLEAALFSAQIRLQNADMSFYRNGFGRPVMTQILAVIDRHAERDEICSRALSCITMDCLDVEQRHHSAEEDEIEALLQSLDVEEIRKPDVKIVAPGSPTTAFSFKNLRRAEPAGRITRFPAAGEGTTRETSRREGEPGAKAKAAAPSEAGYRARDAADLEAAIDRAFRCLNDEAAQGRIDPVIGRDHEIDRILRALMRRRKRSVILHGPAGVGKTAIAEGVAVALRGADVPEDLARRKLYEISLADLVSGARYRGDFEERITRAIERIRKEEAIAFIDEIHTVMGLGSTQTKGMDASNILKPALARGDIIVIGATTTEELSILRQDRAVMRRFELIEICEPNLEDMQTILERAGWTYLDHHGLKGGDDLFATILEISHRLMPGQHFPDKAFDLLDRACVEALHEGAGSVGRDQVHAAARRAGLSLPGRPSRSRMRKLEAIRAQLADRGVEPGIIKALDPGLSLPLLAPAALKGASGWILAGNPQRARDLTDRISDVLGRPVTRFPAARICGPDALNWLVGPSHGAATGIIGTLVEAVETCPDGLVFLEGIEGAGSDVIEMLTHLLQRGEIRTGSGRVLHAGRLRLILSADVQARPAIGFNTQGALAFPRTMKPLLGLSGLSTVEIGGDEAARDQVDDLLEDLGHCLTSMGIEAVPEAGLRDSLQDMRDAWIDAPGRLRDAALGNIMQELTAHPSRRKWRLALIPDQGATPQLTLIAATP